MFFSRGGSFSIKTIWVCCSCFFSLYVFHWCCWTECLLNADTFKLWNIRLKRNMHSIIIILVMLTWVHVCVWSAYTQVQIENRESDKDTDVRPCERTKTVTILIKWLEWLTCKRRDIHGYWRESMNDGWALRILYCFCFFKIKSNKDDDDKGGIRKMMMKKKETQN